MDDLDLEAAQASEAAEPEPESAVQETVETEESDLPEIAPEWLVEGDPEPDNVPRGYQQQAAWEQYQQPPHPQPVAPAQAVTQQDSAPVQSVPYNRFQEVIQQKNEMAQRLAAYEAQQAQASQMMQQQSAPQSINTVDDLLNVVRQDVKKELEILTQPSYNTIMDLL